MYSVILKMTFHHFQKIKLITIFIDSQYLNVLNLYRTTNNLLNFIVHTVIIFATLIIDSKLC